MIKTVAIMGRVNVGKSALFNCLTNSNDAVVSPLAGTTCDRKYGLAGKDGRLFKLVDSGGVDLRSLKNSIFALSPRRTKIEILSEFKGVLERAMLRQTKIAIKEADLLLMVADWQQGVLPDDISLACLLKKINKPKILVCNKIDCKPSLISNLESFQQLGLGEPVLFSAINNKGRNNLLELVVEILQVGETEMSLAESTDAPFRIAMLGKSGAGKSSLFNRILGKEMAVVSDVYQTTTDSNKGSFIHQGNPVLLTDTPGLLEKSDRINELDEITYQKTIDILKKANAILLVTEVTRSLCSTDQYLANLAVRAKVPIVIVANKWDIFPRKDKEIMNQINIHYRNYLPKLSAAPVIFTSAKTGQGIKEILEQVLTY